MKSQLILSGLLGLAGLVGARRDVASDPLLKRLHPDFEPKMMRREPMAHSNSHIYARKPQPDRFLTNATKKFAVDGKNLPEIDFDVGESYAGLLPISDKANETSELFFWFFPTATKEFADKKEIVIWLNGGPGCSSLLGFLEENGPISWNEGMPKPLPNPWSFNKLSNVIWIEQPVGTGFSIGTPTVTNEDEVAVQFLGFWKNFIETFALEGWKVYLAGESYFGQYGPYISKHFLDAKDKTYYDLQGLLIWDGISFDGNVQGVVPAYSYMDTHYPLMPLSQPEFDAARKLDKECGFYDFIRKYLVYPPSGPMPLNAPGVIQYPNGSSNFENADCGNLWNTISYQVYAKNPCFNIYNIVDRCPQRVDPLSSSDGYFDREDVKRAIHAPLNVTWQECSNVFVGPGDTSEPAGVQALPQVIEQTKNVIFAEGASDYLLSLNGVLLGIQNMTWGCKLGFQEAPSKPFYVPDYGYDPILIYGDGDNVTFYGDDLPAGFGVMGTTHEERGLTFVATQLAGHEGPEYAPAAAFRTLEKLLGRIHSLSEVSPFTLPQLRNITQPKGPLGNGTITIPCYTRDCI